MSKLRRQLEQAKTDYQSARFPGDLGLLVEQPSPAAQVPATKGTPTLRTPRRTSPWMRMGVALAVAACVLVAIGVLWTFVNDRGPTDPVAGVPATSGGTPVDTAQGTEVASGDSTSESFSIVPQAETMSFAVAPEDFSVSSMPSMPSFDEFVSEQAETTTQNN